MITLCSNPVKYGPCSITCSTPDTKQNIEFLLGTLTQGSCVYFGTISVCGPGISQTGNVTTLPVNIPSLSQTAHDGDWACRYGTLTSTAETLTVYGKDYMFSSVQQIFR